MNEAMSPEYSRVKYRSFINSESDLRSFDKGLKNEYDAYFSGILGHIGKTPVSMLTDGRKYIDCNKKHLIERTSLEEECKIE